MNDKFNPIDENLNKVIGGTKVEGEVPSDKCPYCGQLFTSDEIEGHKMQCQISSKAEKSVSQIVFEHAFKDGFVPNM